MTSSVKLNDLTKWAVSTYSNTQTVKKNTSSKDESDLKLTQKDMVPYEPKGKEKYKYIFENTKQIKIGENPIEIDLTGIRSTDEVVIDFNRILNVKKGDLAIIQGEVFKCNPVALNLKHIPLILKRLECIDRRIYDLKIYESDMFMKFRGHPNIISLYSYWSEAANNRYTYKNLIQLYEEATYGDLLRTVILNPIRPSSRLILKYLADISKGLVTIHGSGLVHAAIKPSNIFISSDNTAKIGEFKKVELDSARQTHQLFSKVLIGHAIPKTLIYWAPELLKMEKYTVSADMWALGVTLYQVVTGEHPFNVINEEKFRTEVISGQVDWARLEAYPKIKIVIQNLLKTNPDKRWTASQVLEYCQNDFAIDIQRVWKGHRQRQEFKRICTALVKIQANIKGFLTRNHYLRDLILCKENAALMIQKKFRSHRVSRFYRGIRKCISRCQANALARQQRRAYLKMKLDVMMAQAFIRRYLATKWYQGLKQQRYELETYLDGLNEMINKYNQGAENFKNQFTTKTIAAPLKYLQSFEQYELTKGKTYGADKSHIPESTQLHNEYEKLLEEKVKLEKKLKMNKNEKVKTYDEEEQDAELQETLGDRYQDFKPMMSNIKQNMKKVAELVNKSYRLDLKLQHPYNYSKWDQMHEPFNVVENVLKDDDSVYKGLNPILDFTLHNGLVCFVSEIRLYPGDCGPANVEIYLSDTFEKWTFVKDYKCTREGEQKMILPGELYGKFLRIKCLNNVRGGNISSIKQIIVIGLAKEMY